jgi:GH15 family glucan-1,4-alpha-glucosidase
MSDLSIENHGIIGDLHTAALVGMDGTIDWLCLPHFDSPSVFAGILDPERGGHFQIAAASESRRRQMYLPDSNVLVTRFLTPDGVGEVVDFMSIAPEGGTMGPDAHRLIRLVRGVRGRIPFRLECRPGFDYARAAGRVSRGPSGACLSGGGVHLRLETPIPLEFHDGSVRAEFLLSGGDEIPVVLSQGDGGSAARSAEGLLDLCQRELRRNVRFWQDWISKSQYQGRWREMVKRSCLVLKLMTFAPTGAIVAAPTTSLPERIGGGRNWDYRYTWLRDAAFTVYAFLRVGFTDEANAFMRFLEERSRELPPGEGLSVLYRIGGGSDLPEEILPHLRGYRGSSPVRIGNAAAHQFQLDIAGELLDAIYLCNKYAEPISHDVWGNVRRLVNWVCEHWQEPDEGIWEVRGGRRQFTYSKLMSWVAVDRALRLAEKRSLPADVGPWRDTRDAIYQTIMTRGYSKAKQSFVQSLDGEALDASLLLAPMVKFVSPRDPRMLSTIDAIMRELESDHLVQRYDPVMAPDGVGGGEGTFSMCTFWLAEALARAGRLEEARWTFEKMLGYANHLGLYSEEIALTGEALGNFPQAFTHLGLISAAWNINLALEGHKSGHPRVRTD